VKKGATSEKEQLEKAAELLEKVKKFNDVVTSKNRDRRNPLDIDYDDFLRAY
jgi:hypothetical protein